MVGFKALVNHGCQNPVIVHNFKYIQYNIFCCLMSKRECSFNSKTKQNKKKRMYNNHLQHSW